MKSQSRMLMSGIQNAQSNSSANFRVPSALPKNLDTGINAPGKQLLAAPNVLVIKPSLIKQRTYNAQVINSQMTPLNEERKKSNFGVEPSNPSPIKFIASGDCEEEKEIQDNVRVPVHQMVQHPSRFILENIRKERSPPPQVKVENLAD